MFTQLIQPLLTLIGIELVPALLIILIIILCIRG